MNSRETFHFIKILTIQKNKESLIKNFIKTFEQVFSKSQVKVFELFRIRISGDRKNTLVAINTQILDESIDVEQNEILNLCYSKKKVINTTDEKVNTIDYTYPIFSGKKITYLIQVCLKQSDSEVIELHENLISVFNDLLNLLHSKDHDPLTGLMNRMAYNEFMNVIEVEPHNHIAYASDRKPFTAVGILDIDFFKSVNDNYGHLIGDEVLLIFSQVIKSVFRHTDLLFRYGGEEFIVILKDVSEVQAVKVFERCRKEIEKQEFPQVRHITVSTGFATFEEFVSSHVIVDRADKALYYAKENGRNRVCCYDSLVANQKIEPVIEKENLIGLPDMIG